MQMLWLTLPRVMVHTETNTILQMQLSQITLQYTWEVRLELTLKDLEDLIHTEITNSQKVFMEKM